MTLNFSKWLDSLQPFKNNGCMNHCVACTVFMQLKYHNLPLQEHPHCSILKLGIWIRQGKAYAELLGFFPITHLLLKSGLP